MGEIKNNDQLSPAETETWAELGNKSSYLVKDIKIVILFMLKMFRAYLNKLLILYY